MMGIKKHLTQTLIGMLLLVGTMMVMAAEEINNPRFVINTYLIANGTTSSESNTGISINSSLGQPLTQVSQGNRFSINSGFWYHIDANEPMDIIFMNGFEQSMKRM